jgi:hypothetical protein
MIEIVPDNISIFQSYESDEERYRRIHRRQEIEEEIEDEEIPFYEKGEE